MARTRKTSAGRETTASPGMNRSKANPSTLKAEGEPASATADPVNGQQESENGENGKSRYKSLVIDATKYRTHLNYKFESRKAYESPDPRKIISSIPGTIIKVHVEAGQEVRQGDPMLVLEAMKMRNKIMFHSDGTVKSIFVKEGEKVPKNFVMLELE